MAEQTYFSDRKLSFLASEKLLNREENYKLQFQVKGTVVLFHVRVSITPGKGTTIKGVTRLRTESYPTLTKAEKSIINTAIQNWAINLR